MSMDRRARRVGPALVLLLCALLLSSCGGASQPDPAQTQEPVLLQEEEARPELKLAVGANEVPVIWEDNASVDALRDLIPPDGLRLQLSLYGGFEQVGDLGTTLVSEDVQTRAGPGDVMLYAGSRFVLFYGTNDWSYTRLGRIDLDTAALKELLAYGDVAVTLTLAA